MFTYTLNIRELLLNESFKHISTASLLKKMNADNNLYLQLSEENRRKRKKKENNCKTMSELR